MHVACCRCSSSKSADQILNRFGDRQLSAGAQVCKPPVPCKSSCCFPVDMCPMMYCAASEVKEYHRSCDRSQADKARHHEPSDHSHSAQSMEGLNSNMGKHSRQAKVASQTMVKQRHSEAIAAWYAWAASDDVLPASCRYGSQSGDWEGAVEAASDTFTAYNLGEIRSLQPV